MYASERGVLAGAAEVLGASNRLGPLVITCEHATNLVPSPLEVSEADRPWLETHWGWDPGAAVVAEVLVERLESVGIFSRFSRLVCDPNRSIDDPTWIREQVEGHPLSFNQGVDAAERERRRATYHKPYHEEIDRVLAERLALGGDVLLFSVHSFTRNYLEQVREMEMGVLFDQFEAVANRFANLLRGEGFKTALNEPYSGRTGAIYAARRHGQAHGVIYLEIEVRQDLIREKAEARRIGQVIARCLKELRVRKKRR